MHSLLRTASLHIPLVLKRSETYTNESGSMWATSLHISCVLRWSGTTFIKLAIFIYVFRLDEVKVYPETMIYYAKTYQIVKKRLSVALDQLFLDSAFNTYFCVCGPCQVNPQPTFLMTYTLLIFCIHDCTRLVLNLFYLQNGKHFSWNNFNQLSVLILS